MSDPTAEEVIDAFTRVVRNELEQGREVDLPTLGTLRVEHHPSEMTKHEGTRTLSPPRNEVVFEPKQG